MKNIFFFLLFFISFHSYAQCIFDNNVIVQTVFSDDFDAPFSATEPLDPAKWELLDGCKPGSFNKVKYDKSLVEVSNGKLILKTRKDNVNNDCPGHGGPVGSPWYRGAIRTSVSFDGSNYSLFEARIKLPQGESTKPAFWLFNSCQEFDIFEFDPNIDALFSTVHQRTDPDGTCYSGAPGTHPTCVRYWQYGDLDTEFHTYSIAWRNKTSLSDQVAVTFFFDGKELWTQDMYQGRVNYNIFMWLNTGVHHWSTGPNPGPMEIDYVKVYKTNTNSISALKKEYYSMFTSSRSCDGRHYSMAIGEDNQVFFNQNGWMRNYYYDNNQWKFGNITSWQPDEKIDGDVKTNSNGIYYRGTDKKLHNYKWDVSNGWVHTIINNNPNIDISNYRGSIATHPPGTKNPRVAITAKHNGRDKIFVHSGTGSSLKILDSQSHKQSKGDLNFFGDDIIYKGKLDDELHRYEHSIDANGDDSWAHSKILVGSASVPVPIRNKPGSIITNASSTKIYIVSPNGWVKNVYYDKTAGIWKSFFLTNNFTADEQVKTTSNIIITNDFETRVMFINMLDELVEYKYTGNTSNGWELSSVTQCNGTNNVINPKNNLVAGSGNVMFYRMSDAKIRNVFWRCCESLNMCSDKDNPSLIYRNKESKPGTNAEEAIRNKVQNLWISPNPASSEVKIKTNNMLSGELQVEIYDLTGKRLYSKKHFSDDFISIEDLPIGSYILTIRDIFGQSYNQKLVKI